MNSPQDDTPVQVGDKFFSPSMGLDMKVTGIDGTTIQVTGAEWTWSGPLEVLLGEKFRRLPRENDAPES